MRVVTWNIGGLDDEALDERTEAAVFTAILGARLDQVHKGTKPHPPPEVIVLQEVVPRTLYAHLQPHFAAAGYTVVSTDDANRQNFEVVAYREPFVLRDFSSLPLQDSDYGRVLHTAIFDTPSGERRVLTGHFDSGTEAGEVRTAQLRQVAEAIGEDGVFAGDANLRKDEWLGVRDEVTMRDVWEVLGEPPATRVTWRRGEYKARFDRVFIGPRITPRSMVALGTSLLPDRAIPISDHIGLLVELDG